MATDWNNYFEQIYELLREYFINELLTKRPKNQFSEQDIKNAAIEFLENEIKLYISNQPTGVCGYPCYGDCMSCDLSSKISSTEKITQIMAEISQND